MSRSIPSTSSGDPDTAAAREEVDPDDGLELVGFRVVELLSDPAT